MKPLLVNKLAKLIIKGLHDINIEALSSEGMKVAEYILENGEVKIGYDKANKTPTATIKFRFD